LKSSRTVFNGKTQIKHLHNETLDRFYTGSTILKPEDRLERHLEKFYGDKKFTAKVKDWTFF